MLFMTAATSEYSEAKVLESLLARIAKGDKEALKGNGYIVTSARGHLVHLKDPTKSMTHGSMDP